MRATDAELLDHLRFLIDHPVHGRVRLNVDDYVQLKTLMLGRTPNLQFSCARSVSMSVVEATIFLGRTKQAVADRMRQRLLA